MKKSGIALLAGLLALSVGGVATASALIVSGTHVQPQSGSTDDVLYLAWDTTEDLSQISNLSPTSAAYKKISVKAPEKSENAPDGKFTATLAADADLRTDTTKTASISGVTVVIYDAEFTQEGNPGAGANLIGTLTQANPTVNYVVTSAKVFYLKVTIDGASYSSYIAEDATAELAGRISFTYGPNVNA